MANPRKARVPREEQLRLINECRRSGMTDAEWCRAHDIVPSTFYHWIMRCREATPDQLEAPHYGHSENPRPKQEVVPVDIIPDRSSEPERPAVMQDNLYLDNSHTIEIQLKDLRIRINNQADPVVLAKTLHLLKEFSC